MDKDERLNITLLYFALFVFGVCSHSQLVVAQRATRTFPFVHDSLCRKGSASISETNHAYYRYNHAYAASFDRSSNDFVIKRKVTQQANEDEANFFLSHCMCNNIFLCSFLFGDQKHTSLLRLIVRSLKAPPQNSCFFMFRTRCLAESAAMVKSWRLAEVVAACQPTDVVFSRRVPNKGANFFAWPGLTPEQVAQGMLQMPEELRTAHVVFGRPEMPVDLAIDLDDKIPLGREFRDIAKVRKFQRDALVSGLNGIHAAIKEKGETIESQCVLLSPNLQKVSFHIHIKLKDKAFKDFTHMGAFVKLAIAPKVPMVDGQIYRTNGSLRIFQSKKEDLTSPLAAFDDAFQINIPRVGAGASGANGAKGKGPAPSPLWCPESLMLHSLIARPAGTFSSLVPMSAEDIANAKITTRTATGGSSTGGNRPPMPLTKVECFQNVRAWTEAIPAEQADHYRDWIKVGLYLHRIGSEYEGKIDEDIPGFTTRSPSQEMLRLWIEFSKKSPGKYRLGDCEQRWSGMRPSSSWYSAYCNIAALAAEEC